MYNEALKILNILNNNGYESYIVGGYVRDKLLNIESSDIDIITNAKPDQICNIFNVDVTNNYGSIKLEYNNYEFDITTFRKESDYVDNRRPSKVEYVDTLIEDLYRRDFTINTICINKDGNYIDLLDGIKDLNNKLLKTVGNADKKIKEDSLRILRALRFSILYNLKIDDDLYNAIKNNKKLLNNLSFDRIKKELDTIFSSSNANLFVDMISKLDLSEILKIKAKNRVISTNNYLSVWTQLDYSNEYNFSNKEKKYINDLKNILNMGINNYTVYNYGINMVKEANKILNKRVDIDYIYNNLPIKDRKDIKITYDEIANIVKDKSIINKIYIDLEKEILYNRLKNENESIISFIEGDKFE